LLIHTDDCDAAGEDEQILKDIFSKLNSIWSIKHVDAEYMLGITRKITNELLACSCGQPDTVTLNANMASANCAQL